MKKNSRFLPVVLCISAILPFAQAQESAPAVPSAFTTPQGINGTVYAIAVQQDGKVVVGGEFNEVGTVPRSNIARFNPDGTLDRTIFEGPMSGVNGTIRALAIDSTGAIIAGGMFSMAGNKECRNIARFDNTGKVDPTIAAHGGVNGTIYAIAVQPDGSIVIGGEFSEVGGKPRRNIARFLPDLSLDGSQPVGQITGTVRALGALPEGGLIAGGDFIQEGTSDRSLLEGPSRN